METSLIKTYETPQDVARAVADAFVTYTKQCIEETSSCVVALSGGTTPNELFTLLNTDEYRKQIDWENIFFLWVDERFIPQNDPDNNYFKARERLFSKLGCCAHVYPIPTDKGTVDEAAARYEKEIETVFQACGKEQLDLVLLGLGDDGHLASLFPKSEALHERLHKVAPVTDGKVWDRITLTLPMIIDSKEIWFTVVGDAKKAALSRVFRQIESYGDESWEKRVDKTLPAAILPQHNVHWFVDEKALP